MSSVGYIDCGKAWLQRDARMVVATRVMLPCVLAEADQSRCKSGLMILEHLCAIVGGYDNVRVTL